MLILDFDRDDLPPLPPLEGDVGVKLEPEETIAERINLNPRKIKKCTNRIKNLDSKQVINWTSSTISTNKIWKRFKQIKK